HGFRRELLLAPALFKRAQDRLLRLRKLTPLALLDDPVDSLAHPCLIPDLPPEPELIGEHVLELAVRERAELRVGDAHLPFVQSMTEIGPFPTEPPAARIDAERDEPVESGQPDRGGRVQVGELPSPRRRSLSDADGIVERALRCA